MNLLDHIFTKLKKRCKSGRDLPFLAMFRLNGLRYIALLFVTWLLLFVSSSRISAYETETHANLNQLGAELVKQADDDTKLYSEVYQPAHIDRLREGGIREDDDQDGIIGTCGGGRYMKHFYQPASGLGLAPAPGLPRCTDAVTWARNSDDNLTWTGAIDSYDYTAFSKEDAYERLGHVAHFIGDMAQPDHVHVEPHPHGPWYVGGDETNPWEPWVRDNWNLVRPNISNLTPQKYDSMELHLTKLAETTYATSSFLGNELSIFPPHVNPDLEFGRMFRVTYNYALGQWNLYNHESVDPERTYLGDWDGIYSSDDNFWETRTETGQGLRGLYYVEEIIDAIPTRFEGQDNSDGNHLGYFYAKKLLPLAVENIAGLYQHYHDIVNHPPYVHKVKVSQANNCIYEREWEKADNTNQPSQDPGRTLTENVCNVPVDVNNEITIQIDFGNNLDGSEEKVQKITVKLVNADGVEFDVPTDDNEGLDNEEKVWTATFTLPSDKQELFDSEVTIEITAKDKHNHFDARNYPGDELDSNPSTPAKASSDYDANSRRGYDWQGYEPGTDKNHKIGATGVDVALIIDATGSMSSNDPSGMRREAAKVFIDSAQASDAIAVVSFNTGARSLASLRTINDQDGREALKAAVNQVGQSGGTNINAGLNQGFRELQSAADNDPKAGVLLTDGQHNSGPYNPQSHLQFRDKGWPVYTIGLGSGANGQRLSSIAAETGGTYEGLANPNQLTGVYRSISRQIADEEVVEQSSFTMNQGESRQQSANVPSDQSYATFFTTWPGSEVSMSLVSPSGRQIDPSTTDGDVYHAKGNTYEIYTIQEPEAGQWTVDLYGTELPPGGEEVNFEVSVKSPPVGSRTQYLTEGWNLVSTRVSPVDSALAQALADIAGNYSIILSFEKKALTYDPALPQYSTLTSIDGAHGYWIRMNNDAFLTVQGQRLSSDDMSIELEQGWNLVSYLGSSYQPVVNALASIDGKYTAVLGYESGATSYYPSLPKELNTLHIMNPSQAFWIYMTEAATLEYSQSTSTSWRSESEAQIMSNKPQSSLAIATTNSWVNVYSTNSTYNGKPLPEGTVITAIGEDGRKLGKTKVRESGSYGVLSVYGDDSYTAEVDGARRGEQISFLINGQPATITNGAHPTWSSNGDLIEVDLAATGPTMNYMYLPLITQQ